MIGQNIGKYRVVDKVGRGGMGTVYRAMDETLQREVAIKVLNAELDDPEIAKRFRAEAITVARLTHPGIATIYELFEHDGRWLMVMEFVRGETLEHMVSRMGPLSAQRAAEFCMQSLAALAHAHSMGVVHRDLKPANLMITEAGLIKIMDFGIARVSGTEHLTNAGYMMGTPAYMAPEQVLSKEIDARADLYSMGVVFYRLITAKLPFDGDTAFALAQSQVNDPPTPVATVRTDLPAWAEQVIDRAMRKSPEERFQSAIEFHEAFARCMAGLPMLASYSSSAPSELMMTPPRAMPTGTIQTPVSPSGGLPFSPTPGATPAASPSQAPTARAPTPSASPATTPDASPLLAPTMMAPASGTTPIVTASDDPTMMAPTPAASPAEDPLRAAAATKTASKMPLIGMAVAALVVVAVVAYWLVPSESPLPPTPTPSGNQALVAVVPPADIDLPDESGFEIGAEVPAAEAPMPPAIPPAASAESVIAMRPDDLVAAPSADTPSPAAVSPDPAPVAETPVAFADVRLLVVTGTDSGYAEAVLRFANGQLAIEPRAGGDPLATMEYGRIVSATYVNARDPKWSADGASPPADLDTPGTVFRRPGHWFVLQSADAYLILRLEDSNWDRVVDTLEERATLTVDRPDGGG